MAEFEHENEGNLAVLTEKMARRLAQLYFQKGATPVEQNELLDVTSYINCLLNHLKRNCGGIQTVC